jgi:hypothetical protein
MRLAAAGLPGRLGIRRIVSGHVSAQKVCQADTGQARVNVVQEPSPREQLF